MLPNVFRSFCRRQSCCHLPPSSGDPRCQGHHRVNGFTLWKNWKRRNSNLQNKLPLSQMVLLIVGPMGLCTSLNACCRGGSYVSMISRFQTSSLVPLPLKKAWKLISLRSRNHFSRLEIPPPPPLPTVSGGISIADALEALDSTHQMSVPHRNFFLGLWSCNWSDPPCVPRLPGVAMLLGI
jgi:hypothetical protein